MRQIIGLIFIVVSFFGTIFFKRYKGEVIPYPVLWYIGFIILALLGLLLIYWSYRSMKQKIKKIAEPLIAEFEIWKTKAEIIEPDFDRCEFKSGSYSHEVDDPRLSKVKWLAPGTIASSIDTTITENVEQSYLVYYPPVIDLPEKFISDHFPFDTTTLKYYVIKKQIVLYVDRFDRNKYFFDLKT